MVHSVSGWTRGVQVKLWNSLRTHAIPERLRDVFTTRRYANPHLPYLTLPMIMPENIKLVSVIASSVILCRRCWWKCGIQWLLQPTPTIRKFCYMMHWGERQTRWVLCRFSCMTLDTEALRLLRSKMAKINFIGLRAVDIINISLSYDSVGDIGKLELIDMLFQLLMFRLSNRRSKSNFF